MQEQIYLLDCHNPWELYRITAIKDNDGLHYATCDWYNPEHQIWITDCLTQYQLDDPRPIEADDDAVLTWFGFTKDEIISSNELERLGLSEAKNV